MDKEKEVSGYQSLFLKEGEKVILEKVASLHTSLHLTEKEISQAAREELLRFNDFDKLLNSHKSAWEQLWQRLDWTLDAMGDSVENYQVSKQADTPLLLYLFTPTELIELLEHGIHR